MKAAHQDAPATLFFDEVQNLTDWAAQLKTLVDHSTIHVVVTGSSALRIEMGRDSLAGRITTIEAGVMSLTEIATFLDEDLGEPFWTENGLEPLMDKGFWLALRDHGRRLANARNSVFRQFSDRGGYPLAHTMRTFIETTANSATFGVLVTQTEVAEIDDPRIVALPLSSLMLLR